MTMEVDEPVRPLCRCGDAACPQDSQAPSDHIGEVTEMVELSDPAVKTGEGGA